MENCKIRNILNQDFFGKRPNLFIDNKEKEFTAIGRILTKIYIILYCTVILVYLYILIDRSLVSYYSSINFPDEIQQIKLNKEFFGFYFALQDPHSYNEILDEGIYYPKAYFREGVRINNKWQWIKKELDIEKCSLENFGEGYKQIYEKKDLKNSYCIKNINQTLYGDHRRDNYSLFYISFYPCKNSSINKNKCKPQKEIDYYLNGTSIGLEIQTIYLSPKNITKTAQPMDMNLYTLIGRNFIKEYHVFFQIVDIIKDTGLIFSNKKKERYLKYENEKEMITIKDLEEHGSFSDITIKLSSTVYTENISYYKLTDMVTDIGGFMVVFNILFKFIASAPVNILYKLKIVNDLFSFHIKKQIIVVKKKTNVFYKDSKYILNNNLIKTLFQIKELYKNNDNKIPINSKDRRSKFGISFCTEVRINKIRNSINNINSRNISKKYQNGSNYQNNESRILKLSNNSSINKSCEKILDEPIPSKNFLLINNMSNNIINKNNIKNKRTIEDQSENYLNKSSLFCKSEKDDKNIESKIKLKGTDIYICSYFFNKRQIEPSILLNEGFNFFSKTLDIRDVFQRLNIFDRICIDLVKYLDTNVKINIDYKYNKD